MEKPEPSTVEALCAFSNAGASWRPLDPAKKEIRLLYLLPGEEQDEIAGMITCVSLAGSGRRQYETLSYCWGTTELEKAITLHGLEAEYSQSGDFHAPRRITRSSPVTRNLHTALKYLRYKTDFRCLWIDAICINQMDNVERTQQVQMMGDIYERSTQTVVWLGESDESTDEAIKCIGSLAAFFQCRAPGISPESTSASGTSPIDVWDSEARFNAYEKEHASDGASMVKKVLLLAHIFRRPWFRRIWVIQEVCMSSILVVQCGKRLLEWPPIMIAAFWQRNRSRLFLAPTYPKFVAPPKIWTYFWTASWRKRIRSSSIIKIIFEAGECQATDERDMLFSLFGLCGDTSSANAIADFRPDYTKAAPLVYADFTRGMIRRKQSLYVLTVATCYCPSDWRKREELHLPSWTATSDRSGKAVDFNLYKIQTYNASGESLPMLITSDAWNSLALGGHVLGVVATATGTREEQRGNTSPSSGVLRWEEPSAGPPTATDISPAVLQMWDIVQSSGASSVYEDPFEALVLTLTGGVLKTYDRGVSASVPDYAPHQFVYNDVEFAASLATFCDQRDPGLTRLPPNCRRRLLPLRHLRAKSARPRVFESRVHLFLYGRCFFTTTAGYIGLCPPATREGDIVVALFGGRVPYILRPKEPAVHARSGCSRHARACGPQYEFIGECYLHGRMDGSGVEEARRYHIPPRIFDLR